MNPLPPKKKVCTSRVNSFYPRQCIHEVSVSLSFLHGPTFIYYFAGALLDSASIPGFHCRHAAFTKFSAISIKEFLNNLHHVLNIANAYALYGKIFT